MKHKPRKFFTNNDHLFRLSFRFRLMKAHDSRGQDMEYMFEYLTFFVSDEVIDHFLASPALSFEYVLRKLRGES